MDKGFSPQGYRVTSALCATTLFFQQSTFTNASLCHIVPESVYRFVRHVNT